MEHLRARPHEMNFFDCFLLWLIGVYQAHLSPRKGWRCAYSVLHGGPGCSGFARQTIQTRGSFAAAGLVRARFRDCKNASQTLRAARVDVFDAPPRRENPPRRERKKTSWDDCVPDPCCCAEVPLHAGSGTFAACDASACHFAGCESVACCACS